MSFLEKAWYKKAPWLILLWPISIVFSALAAYRRKNLTTKVNAAKGKVPVVVVGNICVGGAGKTPFVIMLSELLKTRGLKPGIISRGYGGNSSSYPVAVDYDSEVDEVGDEALLLREKTDCPVVVDPDRTRAMERLLEINANGQAEFGAAAREKYNQSMAEARALSSNEVDESVLSQLECFVDSLINR